MPEIYTKLRAYKNDDIELSCLLCINDPAHGTPVFRRMGAYP